MSRGQDTTHTLASGPRPPRGCGVHGLLLREAGACALPPASPAQLTPATALPPRLSPPCQLRGCSFPSWSFRPREPRTPREYAVGMGLSDSLKHKFRGPRKCSRSPRAWPQWAWGALLSELVTSRIPARGEAGAPTPMTPAGLFPGRGVCGGSDPGTWDLRHLQRASRT